VLFALYVAGIVGALAVAWLLKRLTTSGQVRTLMMELPAYHLPTCATSPSGCGSGCASSCAAWAA
jgi:Fe2+ transport system protein B